MMRAVLDPSPDQARRWLVEELAKAEYQDSASFLERFFRWLSDLFNREPTGSADGVSAPPIVLIAIGICLLYTSDAADERSSVDLGGRRIITKK